MVQFESAFSAIPHSNIKSNLSTPQAILYQLTNPFFLISNKTSLQQQPCQAQPQAIPLSVPTTPCHPPRPARHAHPQAERNRQHAERNRRHELCLLKRGMSS